MFPKCWEGVRKNRCRTVSSFGGQGKKERKNSRRSEVYSINFSENTSEIGFGTIVYKL